jgi:hypothetical protein
VEIRHINGLPKEGESEYFAQEGLRWIHLFATIDGKELRGAFATWTWK